MIETRLAEIEDRMATYTPQAQADIRWLIREVRRVHDLGLRNPEPPTPAIYDAVTGLLSDGGYGVRFAMARARAGRNRKLFAVMHVDLAPEAGLDEAVLRDVAGRLRACARETDTLARIDEAKFAMILEDLGRPEHAERVKRKVEAALAAPFAGGALETRVSLQFYPTARPAESSLN